MRENEELKLDQQRTLLMQQPTAPGRAAHVSAASGLVKVGTTLWVAVDDENALARFDGADAGQWVPVFPGGLPAEKEARRAAKGDLEALAVLPAFTGSPLGGVLALGSASAANRTRAVFVPLDANGGAGALKVIELADLLRPVQRRVDQLNLEGAAVAGGVLKLFHRGGERGDNAIIDVDLKGLCDAIASGTAPGDELVKRVGFVELGRLGGVPLGFTDASALPDGRLVFTAAAEETDDPRYDGAVTGSVVGVLSPDGRVLATFRVKGLKLEGVHAEARGHDVHVTLVSDADDEKVAAPLHTAVLSGVLR